MKWTHKCESMCPILLAMIKVSQMHSISENMYEVIRSDDTYSKQSQRGAFNEAKMTLYESVQTYYHTLHRNNNKQ